MKDHNMLKGTIASSGIAIAKAYKIENQTFTIKKRRTKNISNEIERLNEAIKSTKEAIEAIYQEMLEAIGEEEAGIFRAHFLIAEDPEMFERITTLIQEEQVTAEYALESVRNAFIEQFE